MRTFPLRIGTPDGLLFEGEVQRIVCRRQDTATSVPLLEWARPM